MSNKLVKNKNNPQEENEGVRVYNQIGYIFIFLGILSFIFLGIVSLMPQDYEKYNVSLFFSIWALISLALVIVGIIPLLLGKHSEKYRIWVNKDIESYQKWMFGKFIKSIEKEMNKK